MPRSSPNTGKKKYIVCGWEHPQKIILAVLERNAQCNAWKYHWLLDLFEHVYALPLVELPRLYKEKNNASVRAHAKLAWSTILENLAAEYIKVSSDCLWIGSLQ